MNQSLVILFLLCVAFIGSWYYTQVYQRRDITVPPSPTKRHDLYFGYYGCLGKQVDETKDHINLFMESQFDGPDKCIQNILDAKMTTILDTSCQVFAVPAKETLNKVRIDAEDNLRNFFKLLQSKDALKYIKIIYPLDEPNNSTTEAELLKGIDLITKVSSEFQELNGVEMMVIFASDKPFICKSKFKFIGFDKYDAKSSVLVSQQYKDLKAGLLPFQKTVILPAAAYGQDPTPFVNFAQANLEVGIVMPFLWFDERIDPVTGKGSVGAKGARSNGMADKYKAAGLSII